MANIYYNPEEFGLEIFGEIEEPPNYSFDKSVVWRDVTTDALYVAHDSGCSCPSPFEDMGIDDLTPVTFETWDQLEERLNQSKPSYGSDWVNWNADRVELLGRVARHLRGR